MSGKAFTIILIAAISAVLLAGGFVLYLMIFGGREDITVCNKSGTAQDFKLELQSVSTSLPVLEGQLADGACLDARVRVGLEMRFHLTVGGVQTDFGTITSHPFTVKHTITILKPDMIDYERVD